MDKHLNIFNFFNNNDFDLYEDNLSRAFALCLKYDTVFLDNVLKNVLKEDIYNELFSSEYPDYFINIDLQKRPSDLGSYSSIIAIGCSGEEINISKMDEIDAHNTPEPETDVSINIKDTCLIFEFKRTNEDCTEQLKCQAERLRKKCEEAKISYVDFNWEKIVKVLQNVLSLQRQVNKENPFSADFVSFLENAHPEWFPNKEIYSIPFPQEGDHRNWHYLNSSLNAIKSDVAKLLQSETTEIIGKYRRKAISVPWKWANEINIYPRVISKNEFLSVIIYAGDTKSQGKYLYKNIETAIKWPEKICEFDLDVEPYLKFSHFNSSIFSYEPDKTTEYPITHTKKFFDEFAGRYKKEKWGAFEQCLSKKISPHWKSGCEYEAKLIKSNRTYFDFSPGMILRVNIPYEAAQQLEKNGELRGKLHDVICSIKNLIEHGPHAKHTML